MLDLFSIPHFGAPQLSNGKLNLAKQVFADECGDGGLVFYKRVGA